MKFIIIFGPQAVGKMTVGQSLEAKTNLKLFHNHMSIDLVSTFFDYGTSAGKRLVHLIRQEIFEEVSKSSLEGLILHMYGHSIYKVIGTISNKLQVFFALEEQISIS